MSLKRRARVETFGGVDRGRDCGASGIKPRAPGAAIRHRTLPSPAGGYRRAHAGSSPCARPLAPCTGRPTAEAEQPGLRFALPVHRHAWAPRPLPSSGARALRKLPRILSPEEVLHLLEAAPGPGLKYKAALSVAYGAGLRCGEVVMLRVGDIDSERMLIRVELGKGSKD